MLRSRRPERVPYSVPWLVADFAALVAEMIADVERHLRLRAEFERFYEERNG